MLVTGADQHAVPLPAAGLRRLNEHQHLAIVEIRGETAEHPFGEERRTPCERIENPLVIERLHACCVLLDRSAYQSSGENNTISVTATNIPYGDR